MQEEWLKEAYHRLDIMPDEAKEIRERALVDLSFFARLTNPGYMYGSIHDEVFAWLQDYSLFGQEQEWTSNKLIMLPRAHLKSHMVAVWCAWIVTRHPEVTILYVSATSELAIQQLYAIKKLLDSSVYQRYFPEYIHPQEGKREKWSSTGVMVDHPKRAEEGVRDSTIKTAGITTNTTGWHADVIVADDLVVPENAYTIEGRQQVAKKASQFTSIRNAGGFTLGCGTRYHPNDVYATWREQMYEVYDEDGVVIDKKPVWEIKEHVVEEDGVFLWPRTMRSDGKAFGFNKQILARIRAEYDDRVQFYAQYYNDPNDPTSDRIDRNKFQYYTPKFLKPEGGRWFYSGKKLNVYAAVDFAFSTSRQADWTAIVVIGINSDHDIFVLDVARFKTDKIMDYFEQIKELHARWKFNKLRAEVTVAQQMIVNQIKEYVKKDGLTLSVDEYRPNRYEGSKEERIASALEPLYDDLRVWHFEGGWTPVLEEELVLARPAHDDIKDALASAVEIATPPARSLGSKMNDFINSKNDTFHSRFGGVRFR